jgi:hypothetical protein
MADAVVDRVVLASDFDPAGFERGLNILEDEMDALAQRVGGALHDISLPDVDLSPLLEDLTAAGDAVHALEAEVEKVGKADVSPDVSVMAQSFDVATEKLQTIATTIQTLNRTHPDLKFDTAGLTELQSILAALQQAIGQGIEKATGQAGASLRALADEVKLALSQAGGDTGPPITPKVDTAPAEASLGSLRESVQATKQAADTAFATPVTPKVAVGEPSQELSKFTQILQTMRQQAEKPVDLDVRIPVTDVGGFGDQLAVLATHTSDLTDAENENSGASARMVRQLGEVAPTVEEVQRAISEAKRSTDEHSRTLEVEGVHASELRRSFGELARGFAGLAAEESGASFEGSELAGAFASLISASGPLAVVAGTIAIIGTAVHLLTTETREAKREQEGLVKALHDSVREADRGPSGQREAALQRQLDLDEKIFQIERERAILNQGPGAVSRDLAAGGLTGALSGIVDRIALEHQLHSALKERGQIEADLAATEFEESARLVQSYAELRQAELAPLTALITAGHAGAAVQEEQNALLQEQRERLAAIRRELAAPDQTGHAQANRVRLLTEEANILTTLTTEDARRVGVQNQLLQVGLATTAEQARALTLVGDLAALEHDASAAPEARLRAYQALNATVDALTAPLEHQNQVVLQGAQQSAQAVQRLAQQAAELGAPHTLELDVSAALQGLHAVAAELDAQIDATTRQMDAVESTSTAFGRLRGEVAQLVQQRQGLEDLFRTLDPSPVQQTVTALGPLIQRLQELRATTGPLGQSQNASVAQVADLAASYAQLETAISNQGGASEADIRLLQAQREIIDAVGTSTATWTIGLEQAAESLGQLAQARQALRLSPEDFVLQVVVEAETAQAEAQYKAFLTRLHAAEGAKLQLQIDADFSGAQQSVNLIEQDFEEMDRNLSQTNATWRRFRQNVEDTRTPMDKLSDSIHDVVNAVGLAANAASALGAFGDEAEQQIGSVLRLGDALGDLAKNASTGNILGVIGAGIGAIGSIFGKSQTEKDLEEATRENTAAVRAATAEQQLARSGRFEGIGGIAELQATIHDIQTAVAAAEAAALAAEQQRQQSGDARDIAGHQAVIPSDFGALVDAANAAGLTLDELEAVAERYNITLVKDGVLVDGALEALAAKAGLAAQAAEGFGKTFEEQSALATLKSRLAGTDQDPAEQFRESLEGLKGAGAEGIANLFGDPSNLAAVRAQAQRLLQEFEAGTLPIKDLGHLTKDDFTRFLNQTADYLDSFGNSVQEATKALSNVPDTFNLAAAEFNAQAVAAPPAAPAPPPTLGPNIDPHALGDATLDATDGLQALVAALDGATAPTANLSDQLTGAGDGLERFTALLAAMTGGPAPEEPGTAGTSRAPTEVTGARPTTVIQWSGDLIIQESSDPRATAAAVRREFEIDSAGISGDSFDSGWNGWNAGRGL